MYKEKNDKGLGSKTSTIIQQTKHRLAGLCLGLTAGLTLLANTGTAQTPDVEYSTQWGSQGSANGQFQGAYAVAADVNGNVYVADTPNNRIQKFAQDGTHLATWGTAGYGAGEFYYPYGVAVDSAGSVYVADTSNHRIQKFNSSGMHLMTLGAPGNGNGQFSDPNAVTVDNLGNIYVLDTANSRVQKFDASGSYLLQWGSYGTGTTNFMYPRGIAVDANRNVYVADPAQDRVVKFDETGTYLTHWTVGAQYQMAPNGLATDATGYLYVTDISNHSIHKYDGNGNLIYSFGSNGSGNGQFYNPAGVAVDLSGSVYVADYTNYRIQKFTKIKTLLYTLRQPLTMSLKLNTQGESNGFPVIVQTTYSLTSALNDLKIALGVTNFGTGAKLYTHQRFYDNNTMENSIVIRNNAGTEWDANAQIQVTEKAPFVISVSPTSTSGTIKHNYRLQMNLGGMVLQTEGLGTTTWTAEDTNTVSGTTIPLTKLSLAPRGSAVLSGTTNAVVEGTFGWNAPTAVIAP